MGELIVGLIVGYVAASAHGWSHEASLFAGFLLGCALYIASCVVWPIWDLCPLRWLPWHKTKASGPRKASRPLPPCRLCGSGGYVRLGARVMGRG